MPLEYHSKQSFFILLFLTVFPRFFRSTGCAFRAFPKFRRIRSSRALPTSRLSPTIFRAPTEIPSDFPLPRFEAFYQLSSLASPSSRRYLTRNHPFSYPPFFFLSSYPYDLLPTPIGLHAYCIGVLLLLLKHCNIFCYPVSFL